MGAARGHLEQRFRSLYDATYDRLWAFVLRRIASEDEAKDVVADTYMAVWRRIRDIPTDPAVAEAWVFGTGRRVLANHRRSSRRRGNLAHRLELFDAPTTAASDTPDPVLAAALDRVPARDREVLQLALWDGLTHAQIGRVLGCSENAVAIRLHRARARLRASYDALAQQEDAS